MKSMHSYGILEHRGKGRDFTNSLRGEGQFGRSEVRMVLDFWTVTLEVKSSGEDMKVSINTSKYNFKEKKKKKLHSLNISPIYLLTIVVVSTYVQGFPGGQRLRLHSQRKRLDLIPVKGTKPHT